VLEAGAQIPAVTVHGEDGEPVELRGLAADGPVLLAFYLFDWTGT
jgi:peroxiredoxin